MEIFELPEPPKPLYKKVFSLLWIVLILFAAFYSLKFLGLIPQEYKFMKYQESIFSLSEETSLLDKNIKPQGYFEYLEDSINKTSVNNNLFSSLSELHFSHIQGVRNMSGLDFLTNVGEKVVKKIPLEEITVKTIEDYKVDILPIHKFKIVRFYKEDGNESYSTILKSDNTPYEELPNDFYLIGVVLEEKHSYIYIRDKKTNEISSYGYLEVSDKFSKTEFGLDKGEVLYTLNGGATAVLSNNTLIHRNYNGEILDKFTVLRDSLFEYNEKLGEIAFLSDNGIYKLNNTTKTLLIDIKDITELKNGYSVERKCNYSNNCFIAKTNKGEVKVSFGLNKNLRKIFEDYKEVILVEGNEEMTVYGKGSGRDLSVIGQISANKFGPFKYAILKNNKGTKIMVVNK